MAVVLVIVVVLLVIWAIFSSLGLGRPKNLPPGPTRLPLIGNLHLLIDSQPHRSLAKLAQTYGPIMLLKLGQNNTLVISSADAAKQVLQKQDLDFSTRHVPSALQLDNNYADYTVGFLPISHEWRFLRKLLNTNMFSSKSLEASQHLRNQKVKELIAYCQKASTSNDHVDIGRAAFRTALNFISNTIFSKDITDPYEDSAKEFREVVGNIMMEAANPNVVDFFPVLKKIDPQGIRRRMARHYEKVLSIIDELIQERLDTGRPEHDDLLEVCLNINQDNPKELSRFSIKIMILDMFTAGTDTTSSTVEWAMTESLRNPHIMAKLKEELNHVIGKGKIVQEEDLSKLPYLSCIVKETFRLHPPAPLLLPRRAENQVKLDGYIIPKDTQVLVNAWAIGRDLTLWEDPQEFKPERFMTSSIDVRGQDFELIPFGAGRRICPGIPLALRTIPLMLGSLINNFDWNLPINIQPEELDMTEIFGMTLQKANPLCVVPMSMK